MSRLPRIIGIAGKAGSGKDTVAAYLNEYLTTRGAEYKYDETTSFAWPLKKAAMVILPGNEDAFLDDKNKIVSPVGVTARRILQTLGTDWGRDMIDPSIWVKIHSKFFSADNIIVADVRFEDEAAYIRSNGILIHVDRPQAPGNNMQHKSENGVERFEEDIVIQNIFGLAELQRSVNYVGSFIVDSLPLPTEPRW